MNKKIIYTTVFVSLIILIFGYILVDSFNKKKTTPVGQSVNENIIPSSKQIVFYYGITCPHCQEVEEWMKEKKIEEKIKVIKKEVYQNRANQQELSYVSQKCNLNPSMIGVPFLYTDGQCFIGTPDVEKKLAEKAGIKP
jgi:glutaredoxin